MTTTPLPTGRHRRTVLAAVFGNLIEQFDWLAFGLFAPMFAGQFFPSADPVSSLLSTFAVFAAGMFCRPVGGILLARFADRRGRKPALMLAIVLMTGGSLLIGLSPTYAQIGVAAPLLLAVARIAQGISAGGEWPSAVTFLMELAPKNRRCRYGSFFAITGAGGVMIASLLGAVLSGVLGSSAMAAYGWRAPFLLGGVFGLLLLVLRSRIGESAVFERDVRAERTRGSLSALLRGHWRSVLLTVVFVAGTTVVSSIWTAVVPAMGQRIAPAGEVYWVVVVCTLASMAVQIPIGMLGDRFGVHPLLAVFGAGCAVLGPFAYLGIGPSPVNLLFSYGSGILFITFLTAAMPTVMAAMYPARLRTIGIGLPHSVTTAVFGGVTPWLATYLAGRGASGWFIAGAVVTVLAAWGAAIVAVRRASRPRAEDSGARPIGTTVTTYDTAA
jgi:MHS family alpha-ketoglutarate permease-like MFS transporter